MNRLLLYIALLLCALQVHGNDSISAAMGIKSSYPVYRRGGLIGLFVSGKTLGKDLWHFHF